MSIGPNSPMPLPTKEEQMRGPIQSDYAQFLLDMANRSIGAQPGDDNYISDWRDAKELLAPKYVTNDTKEV